MTKKMVLTALLMILATATLFAGGNRELKKGDANTAAAAERKAELLAKIDALETTSYTGTITLNNRRFPELAAGNTVHRLVIFPMFQWSELQVKEGDTVTLEGAKITDELLAQFGGYPGPGMMKGRMWSGSDSQTSPFADGSYLLVKRLTVNGRTYDLKEFINQDQFRYGKGRMQGRGGRMGGVCW